MNRTYTFTGLADGLGVLWKNGKQEGVERQSLLGCIYRFIDSMFISASIVLMFS